MKLHDDFKMLRKHCIIIRRDFNTYNSLFSSNSKDLLSKTAPYFFTDIAEILHRDWILQVCKLADPPETKRKGETLENLSIQLINMQLKKDELMSQEISSISELILDYCKKLVPARNKLLAHSDREHQVNDITLGKTTEKELHAFLENIQQYCDEVGRAIDIGPSDFSCSSCHGDVNDLLKILTEYFKEKDSVS